MVVLKRNRDVVCSIFVRAQINLLCPIFVSFHITGQTHVIKAGTVLQSHQRIFFGYGSQNNRFIPELGRTFNNIPFLILILISRLKLDIGHVIVFDTHQEMICRPVRTRFHAGKVMNTAVSQVMAVPFPVKGELKQFSKPLLINLAYVFIIAVTICIGMHERVRFRHKSNIFGVNVAKHGIVIRDTVLHRLVTFYGKVLVVPDIIHQIMVVVAADYPGQMGIHQGIHIAKIILPSVKYVNIVKPVPIGTQFPKPVFQKRIQFRGF